MHLLKKRHRWHPDNSFFFGLRAAVWMPSDEITVGHVLELDDFGKVQGRSLDDTSEKFAERIIESKEGLDATREELSDLACQYTLKAIKESITTVKQGEKTVHTPKEWLAKSTAKQQNHVITTVQEKLTGIQNAAKDSSEVCFSNFDNISYFTRWNSHGIRDF